MSNKLKQSLTKRESQTPKVWYLSTDDWEKMAASLMIAEELFKKAVLVTSEEWHEWTAEFSENQGFPSIIYHDKPVIPKPISVDK